MKSRIAIVMYAMGLLIGFPIECFEAWTGLVFFHAGRDLRAARLQGRS